MNITDYARLETRSFNELPINSVDSLIFSQLSYLKFETLDKTRPFYLGELSTATMLTKLTRTLVDFANFAELGFTVSQNPRFEDVAIRNIEEKFEKDTQTQFFALTYELPNGLCYVAFRGTDNTVIGWKEDFNLSFMKTVPAQDCAVEYISSYAPTFAGGFYIGGHSKGGNLAIYSAMMCDDNIKQNIIKIFSHDGPGFNDQTFDKKKFDMIKGRVEKTVPQSSLVGMLLTYTGEYIVVKSSKKGGILQHDPMTWLVRDDLSGFEIADSITKDAVVRNEAIAKWIGGLDDEKRKLFSDKLYQLLDSTGNNFIDEFAYKWQDSLPKLMSTINSADEQTKEFMGKTLRSLVQIAVHGRLKPTEE